MYLLGGWKQGVTVFFGQPIDGDRVCAFVGVLSFEGWKRVS